MYICTKIRVIMNNEGLNSITIAQLKQHFGINEGLGNDFMISSEKEHKYFDLFKYPCRLDAIVFGVCTQGSAKAIINLKEYNISAGMMIASTPENIVQVNHTSEDFKGHIIIVSLDFLKEILIDLKNSMTIYVQIKNQPYIKLQDADFKILGDLFSLIYECANSPNNKFKLNIIRNLIASFIYKSCAALNDTAIENNKHVLNRQEAFFKQFMELLVLHHKEERSVGFYAKQMHITPKYMSSLIKKISGLSAAEWIDEYIILEIKALLKYSDMSIQEIAYHFNFSTQSFFGKYFKQHTGMSPSQYKMQ